MEQKQIERQVAYIVSLKEISSGQYVKQEGWEPNYILTKKKQHISRANVIGIVVTIPENAQSIFLDDGTDKIEVRTFENPALFDGITIGDVVLVIARPREYEGSIYLNAEIVRKLDDKGWLEYRKKEIALKNLKLPDVVEEAPPQTPEVLFETPSVPSSPPPVEETGDVIEQVLQKIKDLDSGAGTAIEEIHGAFPDGEKILEELLLKGEIFEISPGKVKILE